MIKVYYIFFILSFLVLLYKRKDFLVLIPIFYIIFETSFNYLTTLSIVTYIRPVMFFILFAFFTKNISINKISKPLFLFLAYTLILVPFSSEVFYSFKGYMQVFISMMCFAISYSYFKNREQLDNLNKGSFAVLVFTVFSSVVGYVYGVGTVLEYTVKDDPEAIGLLRSFGMYSAGVVIGILPLVIKTFRKKIWQYLLILFSMAAFIFILLNVRRTAILIPIIGILTYAWYSPKKTKIISGIVIVAATLLLLSPLYIEKLTNRFLVREERGRFDEDFYKTESRYTENIEVFSNTFSFENPLKSFFGSKIYASGREEDVRNRMYHTDSASLLDGTGIIGVIIYLYFLFQLFTFAKFPVRNKSENYCLYRSTYMSLLFILLFVSINGSIMNVSFRSLVFIYMGAMLALMKKENVEFP